MKKPNIIIVMTDQQQADLRKSRGYPLDTMPFLDEWSEGGVDFAQAYTANPSCMPARVSLFTGRYPSSHQVRTNHNKLDARYTQDLLDVLQEEGYKTALCGKNHSHRKDKDFDFARQNGHLGNENDGTPRTAEQIGFEEYLDATRHMEGHTPAPGGVTVQRPYHNVSAALEFIDGLPKETPFFVWLSMAEPHNPYQVPAPYFDMFPPEHLPPLETTKEDGGGKGAKYAWLRTQWEESMGSEIEARIARSRSNYLGMLRLIDDQLKRLMTELNARQLTEDTLLVFTSDHGDYVGEYGLIRKGAGLPEVLSKIPMVWKGPSVKGLREGAKEPFVNIVDILPTLCHMLGRKAPLGCQGKSLLPLFMGEEAAEKEFTTAYCEGGFSGLFWDENDSLTTKEEGARSADGLAFDCLNTWTQSGQTRALRKGSYKLELDMMGNGYLYHLAKDPKERINRWNQPAYGEIQKELLAELVKYMLRLQDVLPLPHHRYHLKTHPLGYWEQAYAARETQVVDLPAIGFCVQDEPDNQ